jgi:VanZ family protein
MTGTLARRIGFTLFALAAGAVLSIAPTQKIARTAKDAFPVLADIQDSVSVAVGRPVSYADIQDYAHMPFFAALTYLILKVLTAEKNVSLWLAVVLSFLTVTVASVIFESVQGFVPGRHLSLSDAVLNLKGWLAGVVFFSFLWLSKSEK